MKLFGLEISRQNKSAGEPLAQALQPAQQVTQRPVPAIERPDKYIDVFSPAKCYGNFAFMFKHIAEVQFPILYICRRIKNAQFVLRKSKDDSIIWADSTRSLRDRYVAERIEKGLLSAPNPYMTFKEFVFDAFINKFLFGNQYIYAYADKNDGRLWETCEYYYLLNPANVNVYGGMSSVMSGQNITYLYNDIGGVRRIDSSLVYHERDLPSFSTNLRNYVQGESRLSAHKYTVSNIIAVYEARNIIYVKRGAIGLIVNKDKDVDGSVALTQKEKEKMRDEFYSTYGLHGDKSPVAIIEKPVDYIPIGMNIADLEPFKECLNDAAAIAGAYGVDSNLIPREDNPTYSNLNTAEVNVYNSVVLPEVNSWLEGFSKFLGLTDSGYYLDAVWDNVAILQDSVQRREIAKSSISNRCKTEFNAGLITLNDWRVAIGRERLEQEIYNKTLLEMSEEEINSINQKIK